MKAMTSDYILLEKFIDQLNEFGNLDLGADDRNQNMNGKLKGG